MQINEFGGDDSIDNYPEPTAADRGDNFEESDDDGNDVSTSDAGTTDDSGSSVPADAESSDEDAGDDETTGDGAESDEADDDGEEKEGEAEDGDGSDDEPDNKDNGQVPRARLNKEAEKRRAAEAELRELKEQLAQGSQQPPQTEPAADKKPPEFDIDADKFKNMQLAMLDEDTAKAQSLFKELLADAVGAGNQGFDIDAFRDEIRDEIRHEMTSNEVKSKMDAQATKLFERYPEFNHTSEQADETMIGEVIRLRDANVDGGMDPVEAMNDAADYVAYRYGLEDRTAKKAPPRKERRTDVERKKELASKERGKLKGADVPADKPLDISKLSEGEYDKLSEEAKRKARGDYL